MEHTEHIRQTNTKNSKTSFGTLNASGVMARGRPDTADNVARIRELLRPRNSDVVVRQE